MLPAVNVTVAVRCEVEVLEDALMLTEPLPVPEALLTVHHDSLDFTVQLVFEVTVTDWLSPDASKDSVVELMLKVASTV